MNLQIMPHTKPGSSNPQMALPTGLGFEIEKVVGGGGWTDRLLFADFFSKPFCFTDAAKKTKS